MPFDAQASAEVTARDRMIWLRDHIAQLPDKCFDMHAWDCGTAACIGGWCDRLFNEGRIRAWQTGAAVDLGMSQSDARELFFMYGTDIQYDQVTRGLAVAVLDRYLATGNINWDAAAEQRHEQKPEAR